MKNSRYRALKQDPKRLRTEDLTKRLEDAVLSLSAIESARERGQHNHNWHIEKIRSTLTVLIPRYEQELNRRGIGYVSYKLI